MFEIVEAVTVLAIGEVYWSIAMFFIGELCCNVCDWWRMENQKLNKKPCCLYCIIDGVNIQIWERDYPRSGTTLDQIWFHYIQWFRRFSKISNFVTPIRSHGSNTGCMEKSLDTITLLVSSKECYNDYLYPCVLVQFGADSVFV